MPVKHVELAEGFKFKLGRGSCRTGEEVDSDSSITDECIPQRNGENIQCSEEHIKIFQYFCTKGFHAPGLFSGKYDPFSVCIGSEGQFLFTTGKHRLALAKAAGLKRIGVRVSARHIDWISYRQDFASRARAGKLIDLDRERWRHPDLQDLVESIECDGSRN